MDRLILLFLVAISFYIDGSLCENKIEDGSLVGQLRPDLCYMPKIQGWCEEKLKRFFYNKSTHRCEEFIYSGCDGNGNNFLSLYDCQVACYSKPVDEFKEVIPKENPSSEVLKNFKCSRDGMYQHPITCEKFIFCANGSPYEQPCPKGLHFNQEKQQCQLRCNAHCDKNLAQVCGWLEEGENINCPEEELFRHPTDCNRYILCSGNSRHTMRCLSGLHFSKEKERCLPPCDAKCDRHIHCEMENAFNGTKCPQKDGKFADLYDCSIYHECVNYTHKIKSCRSGKYFDQKKGACSSGSRVRCLLRCWKPDGKFPHPSNCELYIYCKNNRPTVKRCPTGKAFDEEKHKCLKIEKTNCRKNHLVDILISKEDV